MSFKETLAEHKPPVDNALSKFFASHAIDDFLYPHIVDFVLAGGKRLRPIALIEAYKACGGTDLEGITAASVCVELFHNSTLIHDDIMDEDLDRRGNPTLFASMLKIHDESYQEKTYEGVLFKEKSALYAVTQAILAGNILAAQSMLPLLKSSFENRLAAIKLLQQAIELVNLGQVKDVQLEKIGQPTKELYMDMVTYKTAHLFAASVKIGAVLAGANQKQLKKWDDYALKAAVAFQLQDDLIDIMPSDSKGREQGSDIKQGKMTLLMIEAMSAANLEQKRVLQIAFANDLASEKMIQDAIDVLHTTKAVEKIIDRAKKLIEESKVCTDSDFFLSFADFMLQRKF